MMKFALFATLALTALGSPTPPAAPTNAPVAPTNAPAAPTAAPAPTNAPAEEASTDTVSVDFIGSSGGLKLFLKANTSSFVMIQQDKLQEVDKDGAKVGGKGAFWNLAGSGAFGELKSNDGVYSTTYKASDGDKTFELQAFLTQTEKQVNDTTSNQTVTVKSNTLKFSIAVTNWAFQNTTNKLQYAIIIKDQSDSKATRTKGTASDTVSFPSGSIELPKTATVDGDKGIAVQVDESSADNKNVITFTFPNFKKAVQYDPDVTLRTASPTAVPTAKPTTVPTNTNTGNSASGAAKLSAFAVAGIAGLHFF
eukprot:CAMPEP_0175134026 /NCGR_PEP_ID=MMETSP0087-20121206/7963_1 /TAXON_ID=136419 /ORGANISM="Unknown Unknown, Strain D1" /LENGTH=308 /DNA_ID=CAMNT_0016416569 /DNA_START=60 /DNA_END=986 /DNA_ORIENTATION=+